MKRLLVLISTVSTFLLLTSCMKNSSYNNGTNSYINNQNKINLEQAKEIALKHANLTSDQIKFTKSEYDDDNGIYKYEIEFYENGIEYDYDVDAISGEIIGFDYEMKDSTITQDNVVTDNLSNNGSIITLNQAKEVALKHANLTSDQVRFTKYKYDFYNGIEKYELEFSANGQEYDYDINAASGEIIAFESEVD